MAKVEFFETGIKEIDEKLQQLKFNLAKRIVRREIKKALIPIEAEARSLAPVGLTGRLHQAIRIKSGRSRNGQVKMIVSIDRKDLPADVFYGGFVNWGTKYMKARLFLTEAYEHNKEKAKNEIIAGVLKGVDRALKRK